MTHYLLVHGGAHAAWSWDRLIPHLQQDRRVESVMAVELIGHGTRRDEKEPKLITREDHIQDLERAIRNLPEGDVIVVAHAGGGQVAPQAVARVPHRVKRVVFIAAMIPSNGKTVRETLDEIGFEARRPAGLSQQEQWRQMFCNDMDEATTQWVLQNLQAESAATLGEPVNRAGYPQEMPATYVVCTRDQSLTPKVQRTLLKNIGAPEVIEMDAGHDPMISRPKDVADILLRYA